MRAQLHLLVDSLKGSVVSVSQNMYIYLGKLGGDQCPAMQVAPEGPSTMEYPLLH